MEEQALVKKSATLRSFVLNVLLAMREMDDRVEGPVVCEDGVCQAVIDGKMQEWDEFGTTHTYAPPQTKENLMTLVTPLDVAMFPNVKVIVDKDGSAVMHETKITILRNAKGFC